MTSALVATDNAALYQVLSAELEGENLDVYWAVNGKEAFDMTLEMTPDLAFLDAHLPLFSGLALSRLLRAEPSLPPELPIVLLSDEPIEPHAREKARISAVLPKQHQVQELREMISKLTLS